MPKGETSRPTNKRLRGLVQSPYESISRTGKGAAKVQRETREDRALYEQGDLNLPRSKIADQAYESTKTEREGRKIPK